MESDRLVEGAFLLMFACLAAHSFGRQGWRRALQDPSTYVMFGLASLALPHAVGVVPKWLQIAMWCVAVALIFTAVSVAYALRNTRPPAP